MPRCRLNAGRWSEVDGGKDACPVIPAAAFTRSTKLGELVTSLVPKAPVPGITNAVEDVHATLSDAVAESRETGQPTMFYFQQATKEGMVNVSGFLSVEGKTLSVERFSIFPNEEGGTLANKVLQDMMNVRSKMRDAAGKLGFEKLHIQAKRIGETEGGSTKHPRNLDNTYKLKDTSK